MELIARLSTGPVAVDTQAANEQHYELPTAFFKYVMGRHMKYSCCYWDAQTPDLSAAEQNALEITCARAGLKDHMDVLELGCGWGSLTLFMAAKFPGSRFTAVSNSATQKAYIDACCLERGLPNVQVITADMNVFQPEGKYDRIVSVEMFEHMRNFSRLLHNIAGWLRDDGKLFVHIFTHHRLAYLFEEKDASDWMSKYFFTGGIMPSDHLLFYFNDDMQVEDHWLWDGTHYGKTAEAWLANQDAHRQEIMPILTGVYGKENALKWWVYWRLFFMACAELWNFRSGREWMVSHYLFRKHT